MKVLITGVTGFIGSFLAKHIARTQPNTTIVGLARNSFQKHLARLEELRWEPRFHLVYCDFAKDSLSEIFDKVDIIYHLGAKTFVDHSVIDPSPFIESNIIGTWKILDEARRHPIKKIVIASTDEVYGPIASGSWKETDRMRPTNPYASSKACADLIALTYHKTFKSPIVLCRAENVYGPFQHPQKVMPAWIKRALNGEPLLIYGDGKHKRRWLHVEDDVRAFVHIGEHGKIGEIYHIAGEEELENRELAIKILQTLNLLDEKPNYSKGDYFCPEDLAEVYELITFIDDSKIRPFHDRRYAVDISKLRALGWKPKHSSDSGLENVINWYKNNLWWLQ